MLPAMSVRRVPPLPVALALVAAALIAAALTTRSAVVDAFAAVRDGQALAVQQAVRADLVELGQLPTNEVLAQVLADHSDEGLRYIAIAEGRRVIVEAGQPVGTLDDGQARPRGRLRRARGELRIEQVGDRMRIELPAAFRRTWGAGRPARLVVEIETSQASTLRSAATRTVAIGAIAAFVLLALAGWLVRRELRRRAEEGKRERERRLASLGEMSAVLAHEIRNPLASLKGNAQLLAGMVAKRGDSPEDEKTRAKADRVVEEAVRLERLTQDLLAYVRTGEIARSPSPIASLVRGAAAAVSPEIMVETIDADVSLDAARMHQVLVNLLENAVAAGPPVTLRVTRDSGHLVIEVSDSGGGVAAGDREKVFEPFFTNKTRGTGLGLAIARRVVEQHRGTLTVHDAPTGGACFRIRIPETT